MVALLPPELITNCIRELVALPTPQQAERKPNRWGRRPCQPVWRHDLLPYLAVSSQFAEVLRPEVYKSIRLLSNTEASDKLVKILLDTPLALPHVRHLTLEWSRQCCPTKYLPTRPKGRCARLAQLLMAVENLKSLNICFADDQRHHVVQLELLLSTLVSEAPRFRLERFGFNAINEVCHKMRVRVLEEFLLTQRHTLSALALKGPWGRDLVFSARALSKLSRLRELNLNDVAVRYWPTAKDEWESRCRDKHYLKFNSEDYGNDLVYDFDKSETAETTKDEVAKRYRIIKPRQPSTPYIEPAAYPLLSTCHFGGRAEDLLSTVLPFCRHTGRLIVNLQKSEAVHLKSSINLPELKHLELRYLDLDPMSAEDSADPKPVQDNLTNMLEAFEETNLEKLCVVVARAYDLVAVARQVTDLVLRSPHIFAKCKFLALKLDCSEPAFVKQQERAMIAVTDLLETVGGALRERGISHFGVYSRSQRL